MGIAVNRVVSACGTCKHAEWQKTSSGRRHPNGSGVCRYQFPESPLPLWARGRTYRREPVTTLRELIEACGNSRFIVYTEHRSEKTPCAAWEAKP